MSIPSTATGVTSFLHVQDAALAAMSAVDSDVAGVFNIADDEPAEGATWLPEYARLLGLEGTRVDSPDDVAGAWDHALRADRPVLLEMVADAGWSSSSRRSPRAGWRC